MNIGMLWFDNSKNDLETKIIQAMHYYEKKYGHKPNKIYINRGMLVGTAIPDIKGVSIITSKSIDMNHFWIGMDTP